VVSARRVLRPSDAELAILQVLWEERACTVRAVHGALVRSRGTTYTTILKLMQIMTRKGLVKRDTSSRAHVYQAEVRKEAVQQQLLAHLARSAFGGSITAVIDNALRLESSRGTRPLKES
jgi:predicted transcriptional regulator